MLTLHFVMEKLFHQRFSIRTCLPAVVLALAALLCFWIRSGIAPFVGLVAGLLAVKATERLINTTYSITADGHLIISQGRLSRPRTIPVADIIGINRIAGSPLVAGGIMIELASGKMLTVRPENEQRFENELRNCINTIDKQNEKK